MGPAARRKSIAVRIDRVTVGGTAPIVVQSMTNTDTADVASTVTQVEALARAGSELVRVTVDRDESARAVPHIREALDKRGIDVPLIGDFHYIGHKLLTENPACAEALAKYRINPGNVGFREKRDRQFSTMIEVALKYGKPVRIGVNWGSLDQELLVRLMDENSTSADPKTAAEVMQEAMVVSAIESARRAEELGLSADRHYPVVQGQRGAEPDCRLQCPRRPLLIRAASRADRSGDGIEGHRRVHGGHGGAASAGSWRHHPGLADAATGRRPYAGSHRRAGDAAGIGPANFHAARHRMPRLRTYHQHLLPEAGWRYPGSHPRPHAAMVEGLRGSGDDDGGGDGLHRQRPRREQTRRYRHQPPRHRRGAVGAGVHRWQEGDDAARPGHRHRVPGESSRITCAPAIRDARRSRQRTDPPPRRSSRAREMAGARTVRGTRDLLPDESRKLRFVEDTAWQMARCYGYGEITTPIFEFTEVFARTLGDTSDVVTKEMYTFEDRGGDSLTLRPENTAGIVRAFLSNSLASQLPQRIFYRGPMFRYERPQKGRLRQFHQVGVELLGAADPLADVEVIGLAYEFLCALGLGDKITLELNTLGNAESRSAYRACLVDYLQGHRGRLSADSTERLERNPLRILDSKDEGDRAVIDGAPTLQELIGRRLASLLRRGSRRPERAGNPAPHQFPVGARARLLLPYHLRVHHGCPGCAGYGAGGRPVRRVGAADGRAADARHGLGRRRRAPDDAERRRGAGGAAHRDDRSGPSSRAVPRCGWHADCGGPVTR